MNGPPLMKEVHLLEDFLPTPACTIEQAGNCVGGGGLRHLAPESIDSKGVAKEKALDCTGNQTRHDENQEWRAQNYLESVSWSVIMIVIKQPSYEYCGEGTKWF